MIYIIISIMLDGLLSKIIPVNILSPTLTVITLLLMYPKCKNNFFKYIFITGIIYDLLYSDILFLNLLIFILLYYIIEYLYIDILDNTLSLIYRVSIITLLYRLLSYILAIFLGSSFNLLDLYMSIINSAFINIIYGYIWYNLIKKNYLKV